jgi:hypothetical protein
VDAEQGREVQDTKRDAGRKARRGKVEMKWDARERKAGCEVQDMKRDARGRKAGRGKVEMEWARDASGRTDGWTR